MTQTLKKEVYEVEEIDEYYKKFYKSQRKLKPIVLNYLFRNYSFVNYRENIYAVSLKQYEEISEALKIPINVIHKFISHFLIKLIRFREFLTQHPNVVHVGDHQCPLFLLLRKVHQLAPIFNYQRAKENARRLKQKLDLLCFWPQLMTQVAVVIFITDYLDKDQPLKLNQTNLRVLCHCSAYAFHRTRNKIGLSPKDLQSLTVH